MYIYHVSCNVVKIHNLIEIVLNLEIVVCEISAEKIETIYSIISSSSPRNYFHLPKTQDYMLRCMNKWRPTNCLFFNDDYDSEKTNE